MISKDQKERIISKLEPYGPDRVGIFGSYARGTETSESDLDLLVHLQKRINLFQLIDLEEELSEVLGIKVDLITEDSLNKHMKPFIMDEVIYLLDGK